MLWALCVSGKPNLRHVHLGLDGRLPHPCHVTSELDVAVGVDSVLSHVCVDENTQDVCFQTGSAFFTDILHNTVV